MTEMEHMSNCFHCGLYGRNSNGILPYSQYANSTERPFNENSKKIGVNIDIRGVSLKCKYGRLEIRYKFIRSGSCNHPKVWWYTTADGSLMFLLLSPFFC